MGSQSPASNESAWRRRMILPEDADLVLVPMFGAEVGRSVNAYFAGTKLDSADDAPLRTSGHRAQLVDPHFLHSTSEVTSSHHR